MVLLLMILPAAMAVLIGLVSGHPYLGGVSAAAYLISMVEFWTAPNQAHRAHWRDIAWVPPLLLMAVLLIYMALTKKAGSA